MPRCTCGVESASPRVLKRLHRASRALRTSLRAAARQLRRSQSPALNLSCGGRWGRASQRPGTRPDERQVRPLTPRRGPNARTLRDQGGGAPKAGGREGACEGRKRRTFVSTPSSRGPGVPAAWLRRGCPRCARRSGFSRTPRAGRTAERSSRGRPGAPGSWFSRAGT